jgi:hypothetical protein
MPHVSAGEAKEAYKCFADAGEKEFCTLLEEADGAEDVLCCVCIDRAADTKLLPCGHVRTCVACTTDGKEGQ